MRALALIFETVKCLLLIVLWGLWQVAAWPFRGIAWIFGDPERVRTIALILGGLWAFWLYLVHVGDKQVEQTLKYVERHQGKDFAEHVAEIGGYWTTLDGVGVLFTSSDVELKTRATKRIQEKGLEKHLAVLLSFYSEVALCTLKGVCDKGTACAYFRGPTHTFYEIYHPIIEIWGLGARADLFKDILQFRETCDRRSFLAASLTSMGLPSSSAELRDAFLRTLPASWCPRGWETMCTRASRRKAGP